MASGVAVAGVLTFFGGMVWSVVSGVAVPYQDATPEMIAYERFHFRLSSGMLLVGVGLIAVATFYTLGLLMITLGPRAIRRRLNPLS